MTLIATRSTGGIVKAEVATGGSGYTAPPSITVSGGGGTGATVVAVMAGTRVAGLLVKSQGTGFTSAPTLSFSGGGGTGAAGTAYVQSGVRYMTFMRGRNGDAYGVDGMGRGIRWDGAASAAQPIGLAPPCVAPGIASATASVSAVQAVQIVNGGAGYNNVPQVVFTGGSPTTPAQARASISNGRVASVVVTNSGAGYQATPSVSFSSGIGSSASFGVGVVGGIRRIRLIATGIGGVGDATITTGGQGYQGTPSVAITGGGGTGASATAATHQVVSALSLSAGGTGYTAAPLIAFSGGGGTGAAATCDLAGTAVATLYLASAGSGYTAAPSISFSGGGGSGAAATASMDTQVASVVVYSAGTGYTSNPTLSFSGGTPSSPAAATVAAITGITTGAAIQWHNTNGLTGQHARIVVSGSKRIEDIILTSAGTGCTQSGVTASLVGASALKIFAVDQFFSVSSVSAITSGSGYMSPPVITVLPAKEDVSGGGAALTCTVNTTGNVSAVTVLAGGTYSAPPTAVILDTSAKATATMAAALNGKYRCCFRYLDATPESRGGPIPSSISDIKEVDIPAGGGSLTWTLDTSHADARATHVELWRTSADQSVLLFRVATLPLAGLTPYVDSLSDNGLTDVTRDGYGLMPITLPSGQINARRFGVPPPEFMVACMFQDRAWYGVDTTGKRPNALMFSEVDEPESVPEDNELIIQENTGEPDRLVGMVPLGSFLLLLQTSHLYRLTYVAQPVIDAAIVLGAYRGILNSRCWCVVSGVAFIVDSFGMYAYDGQQEDAVSLPVDNYWRDGVIDFSAADSFHVQADIGSRTVRFFYRQSGDPGTHPIRALCYCLSTKAWWEEVFADYVSAGCSAEVAGRKVPLYGTADGSILRPSGTSDRGSGISYLYRSPEMPLTADGDSRSVTLLYKPTSSDASITLQLAFNNSATPRPNVISADRGAGFVATAGASGASLNMKLTRSPLGEANGVARANFSGSRADTLSAGGDRHVAALLSGAATQPVVIRSLTVEGVG